MSSRTKGKKSVSIAEGAVAPVATASVATASVATASVATASRFVQVLLLTQKAEVKEAKLQTAADGTVSLPMLQTLLKKKEMPEFIGSYKNKSQTLYLFGYLKGKAGTENKHELPPPHDSVLLFGDVVVLASTSPVDWRKPIHFKSADYEAFYTRAFGGFEELGDEEEGEEVEDAVEDIEGGGEDDADGEADGGEAGDDDIDDEGGDDEDEDDSEEVGNDEGGELDDNDVVPVVIPKAKKKARVTGGAGVTAGTAAKKKVPSARSAAGVAAAAAAATAAYSLYLYIPAGEELREQWGETPYERSTLCKHRANTLSSIETLFKEHLTPAEAEEFERCIYNMSIRKAEERHVGKAWSHPPFVELYKMTAKTLASNFHPDSYVKNTELFQRYKDGVVTFADLCGMDSYQMFEARWRDNFIQQQLQEKRQLEGNKAMATDRFVCTRCWKRECTYYEMQTRSADEPMTIFITCLNCGKHWRQ